MMTKLEIIELVVIALVAVVLTVYYLIQAIKNGWVQKLTLTINDAIKYAELNIRDGKEKKAYVLKKVEEKCEELGIPYTLIYKLVNKLIDRIIANYNVIKK